MRGKAAVFCIVLGLGLFLLSPAMGFEELANHPARDPEHYRIFADRPPWERIAPAPEVLVDYLKTDNKLNGYPEVPQSAPLDQGLLADFQKAVQELPAPVQRQIADHLAGIFTVRDLGTTGLSEMLRKTKGPRKGFIVIDVHYINKKANEWVSWRANSPFAPDGKTEIRATVENPEDNTRKQAVQYILVHEMGHLIGAALGVHPDWNGDSPPEDYPFSKISWFTKDGSVASKFESQFPLRSSLRFYSFESSKLSAGKIPDCYAQLEQTDFCSLYGGANMFDDFAEAYTVYVHALLQKKPWVMDIYADGRKVGSYASALMAERAKAKREFLEGIFK